MKPEEISPGTDSASTGARGSAVERPRLLDLFCGAGGAGMGYHRAGFDVTGVDIKPQPRYPFTFIQADALEYCREHGHEYDAIHASPPCQDYTTMNNRWGSHYPRLIPQTRKVLRDSGKSYVLENVSGARRHMENAFALCGSSFGLRVWRHRLFESNVFILSPKCNHSGTENLPIYGKLDGRRLWTRVDGTELRACKSLDDARLAMDISWMKWDEIREAIPPAYTEWIGKELLRFLGAER